MGQEAESEQSEKPLPCRRCECKECKVGDNTGVLKQVKNTEHWRRTRDERSDQPFIDSSRDTR